MSYASINTSAQDEALIGRIRAATVQEAWNNPASAATEFGRNVQLSAFNSQRMVYSVCVASDIEAAYAYALAAGNLDPGGDESVVTDQMILSNVAANWPQDEVT